MEALNVDLWGEVVRFSAGNDLKKIGSICRIAKEAVEGEVERRRCSYAKHGFLHLPASLLGELPALPKSSSFKIKTSSGVFSYSFDGKSISIHICYNQIKNVPIPHNSAEIKCFNGKSTKVSIRVMCMVYKFSDRDVINKILGFFF